MQIIFIPNVNTFGSNVVLTNFENVTLAKVVHIYVIKGLNA
jgi:hypothetical protein